MPDHTERLHALDAVRASALLLGIVLHGTMSFVVGVPALDNSPSTTLSVIFFVIHIFRMSLFYIIAGFFAAMMLEKKGWRGFTSNRLKRIGLPMIIFWFILLPLTIAPTLWGMARSYSPEFMASLDQGDTQVPLLHLWFLYYLLIFYVITVAGYLLVELSGIGRSKIYLHFRDFLQQVIHSPIAPLLLALPIADQFLHFEGWNAWAGIPTHDAGLIPWPSQIVMYGIPFMVGWLVYGRRDILQRWQQFWSWYLVIAALLSAWCLSVAGLELNVFDVPDYFAGNGNTRALYALAYAMAIWCWSFGLTGCAMQFCSQHNPYIRYMADASYWLYLMHLPLIFFLQALMMNWPLHWSIKYALILLISFSILLWTYKKWVRPTRIGLLLNGRRYDPKDSLVT